MDSPWDLTYHYNRLDSQRGRGELSLSVKSLTYSWSQKTLSLFISNPARVYGVEAHCPRERARGQSPSESRVHQTCSLVPSQRFLLSAFRPDQLKKIKEARQPLSQRKARHIAVVRRRVGRLHSIVVHRHLLWSLSINE
jgi:hypothetical protein